MNIRPTKAQRQPNTEPKHALVGKLNLAIALFGAPAAWIAQMASSEIITGNGCGAASPLLPPWFALHVHGAIAFVGTVCLSFGLLSGAVAWRAWRHIRYLEESEKHHVIETGEGRVRFLVMLGLLDSGIFIAATLFTAMSFFLVAPCGQ